MTLTADSAGKIAGKFTIPASVKAGTKLIVANGQGGSVGRASFTGKGTITTITRRSVTTSITANSPNGGRTDPLAQTFTLSESRHVAGCDLWFTNKGNADVVIQIRDTASGYPSTGVLAEKRITINDISVGGASTRILFDDPVWLDAGTEYALVILTDSATTAVSVAQLGKFDSTNQKWITSQAYQVGVLLSSSNASTWTAHQDQDLAFRLLGCRFSATSRTIDLGTITVADASNFLAEMSIDIPATGAGYQLTATDVANSVNYRMSADAPVELSARINGNVALSLALSGTDTVSPVVYPGLQFIAGDQQDSGVYVSRAFACGSSARVSVTFEAYTPGTSTVDVEIQKSDGNWQTVALTSGSDVGDGWSERRHIVTGFTATTTRVRLTLTGTAAARPKVRQLRAVTTD